MKRPFAFHAREFQVGLMLDAEQLGAPLSSAGASRPEAEGRAPRISFVQRLDAAVRDLTDGFARWQLWSALAWEDIRSTYRRSIFGALWITLSFAAFVVAKLLIFIPIMSNVDNTYYAVYLMVGFFVWQFLAAIVNSAPTVFVTSENWIKNDPLPLSVYVYKSIAKSLFSFALTAIVVVGVLIYFRYPIDWHAWLIAPAIALYILNAGWVMFFLGVTCTRFRDFTHLVQTAMRVMFFLTPIFWLPAQMGELMRYLWWNPFSHFMWILRSPLIDHEPAVASWIFVSVLTIVGWAAALLTFAAFRRRIIFWF